MLTLGQQQVHFEFTQSNYLLVTFVRMVLYWYCEGGILVSDGYSVQIQPVCTDPLIAGERQATK